MNTSSQQHLFPIILGAMLVLLVGVWGSSEILRTYAQKIKDQHAKASATADFIEAGLRPLLSRGNVETTALTSYFSELKRLARVECALHDGHGSLIASSGANAPSLAMAKGEGGDSVQGSSLTVWRILKIQDGMNTAGVAQGSSSLQEPLRIVAKIDMREFGEWGGGAGDALLIGVALGCCGMVVLALAWSYSIRNRNLQVKLNAAKDREEHIEELSLAAAGLAHETKNPLGIIRGLAQRIAEEDVNPEKVRQMAKDIMEEADITTARLGDFMCYAKIREPELAPIDIQELVQRMRTLVDHDFEEAGVSLEAKADAISILADGEMLSQAMLNLLLNSLRATEKGGKVVLSARKTSHARAAIAVADTGKGIPPELLPNIFKPYMARKAHGYGIGLAIVSKIVERSGWTISVASKVGEGTTITISDISLA